MGSADAYRNSGAKCGTWGSEPAVPRGQRIWRKGAPVRSRLEMVFVRYLSAGPAATRNKTTNFANIVIQNT